MNQDLMNQNLLKFFEDISKDEEKLKKLFSYEDMDKMYEYAISESKGNFKKKEFEECLNSIIKLSESINSGEIEISKEDLKSGKIDDEVLNKVSGGVDETLHRSIVLLLATLIPAGVTLYTLKKNADAAEEKNKKIEEIKKTPEWQRQQELKKLEEEYKIEQYKKLLGKS